MNRAAYALVGSAAAQYPGHGGVDLRVIGIGSFSKQRGRRHNLAGLTITALRYALFKSGFNKGMIRGSRQSFDSGDFPVLRFR